MKEWQYGISGLMLLHNLAKSSTTVIRKVWNVMPSCIGEIAYRRDDGVYVVPLGCLKD